MLWQKKVIRKLIDLDLKRFIDTVASESPAPGGGSVSAYMGAMGVALGTMVANLSSHKKGWDDRWKEFSDKAENGKEIMNKLLDLVDEDTEAFNKIIEANRLPGKTDEEIKTRQLAIQTAVKNAIMVPFAVMETAFKGFDLIKEMVLKGNPSSVTDAGTGALALLSCIKGAFMNVKINSVGLNDNLFSEDIIRRGNNIEKEAISRTEEIMQIIDSMIIKQ